jgi:predicted pyridoxine 5'-phosphate oxidase superfamily flavin-nucleotide-binding protein
MSEFHHAASRQLQDQFDTRRLADRLEERIVGDSLSEDDRALIERMEMFFVATADAEGKPQCSYKGGDPGFVRVVDEHTIAFPAYDGNGMFLSMGNLLANPHVGLLFVDFVNQHRLRFNGVASIDPADPVLDDYPEAQFVVRVRATEVFPNCPRYVHKMQLVARSNFVPRVGCKTPAPEWKSREWLKDVLPGTS